MDQSWCSPHHPKDAPPRDGITFLNCDIAEAVETGLAAAGGKDLEVFGADLARQCLERCLLDEFHVHLAPVMLGDGIRLLDAPGTNPVRWERILDPDSGAQVLDLRYTGGLNRERSSVRSEPPRLRWSEPSNHDHPRTSAQPRLVAPLDRLL